MYVKPTNINPPIIPFLLNSTKIEFKYQYRVYRKYRENNKAELVSRYSNEIE